MVAASAFLTALVTLPRHRSSNTLMMAIMEEDSYRLHSNHHGGGRLQPHQDNQVRADTDETTTTTTSSLHSSDYAPKLGHPTSYDDDPPFKGPLTLSKLAGSSSDYNRVRIRHYYDKLLHDDDSQQQQSASIHLDENGNVDKSSKKILTPSTPTNVILKAIIDHLAYRDAPVDVKEVAESIEFYLRCGKRLLGAARRTTGTAIIRDDNNDDDTDDDYSDRRNDMMNNNNAVHHQQNIINVQDLCSGHGLTGMIFLACNPPGRIIDIDGNSIIITTTCIDIVEPKSHIVLRGIIAEICPWVGVDGAVSFITSPLEDYATVVTTTRQEQQQQRRIRRHNSTTMETIVISTHACGSLTDKVLHYALTINASSIAVMPCCYTGTADGAPYGVKRMLGVSLAADMRRSFALQECGNYHVDFASIPKSITPMNRIIVAERRKKII